VFRQVLRDPKKEQEILNKLEVDESGFVVFKGHGPLRQRTGSQAMALINWHLYRDAKEKPLDYDIFHDFITK
jgi:hypothetical protein